MATLDEIRASIEQRLDMIVAETERLQRALDAIEVEPRQANEKRDGAGAVAPKQRTPRGSVRDLVLAAFAEGDPQTSGEVARRTGLHRATVAATLSRLHSDGSLERHGRGRYSRAGTSSPTAVEAAADSTSGLGEFRDVLRAGLRTLTGL